MGIAALAASPGSMVSSATPRHALPEFLMDDPLEAGEASSANYKLNGALDPLSAFPSSPASLSIFDSGPTNAARTQRPLRLPLARPYLGSRIECQGAERHPGWIDCANRQGVAALRKGDSTMLRKISLVRATLLIAAACFSTAATAHHDDDRADPKGVSVRHAASGPQNINPQTAGVEKDNVIFSSVTNSTVAGSMR